MYTHIRGDVELPHSPVFLKLCERIKIRLAIHDPNFGAIRSSS